MQNIICYSHQKYKSNYSRSDDESMDKVFKNINRYDFFGIFGAGIIILFSGIAIFLSFDNRFSGFFDMIQNAKSDWSVLAIFILTVWGYAIGILLQSIARFLYDFKFMGCKLENTIKTIFDTSHDKMKSKILYPLKKYLYSSVIDNELFDKNTKQCNFDERYESLKIHQKDEHIGVLHSIHALARSLHIGYFILAVLVPFLNNGSVYLTVIECVLCLAISVLFNIRAIKYYYKWVACVFLEYHLLNKYKDDKNKQLKQKERNYTI